MVLYGALVEELIARLFMAGVLPGLLMAGDLHDLHRHHCCSEAALAPRRATTAAGKPPASDVLHVFPVLGLLVVVLGSIYSGIATPTEAAALGAAGAHRAGDRLWQLHAPRLHRIADGDGQDHLHGGADHHRRADPVDRAHLLRRQPRRSANGSWAWACGKWEFFIALVMLYIVLGCFVDGISMIYMTLPVLLPVVKAFGFDLIWFGIILTVLIELGQITPPVGLNLFTIHAISGGAKFSEVAMGSLPYVFLMLLVILLLCFLPEIALWLPTTMRGKG